MLDETKSCNSFYTILLMNILIKESFWDAKYALFILSKRSWPPNSAKSKASVVRPHFKAVSAAYSIFPIKRFLFIMPSGPSSQLEFFDIVSVTNEDNWFAAFLI